MSFMFVALGGFLGSIFRYSLSVKANKHFIGTWIANITGSIFLAFLFHYYYIEPLISDGLWLFAGVGFSGAYTTFSTFGIETVQLILNKKYLIALSYVISSLAVAILAVGIVLIIL